MATSSAEATENLCDGGLLVGVAVSAASWIAEQPITHMCRASVISLVRLVMVIKDNGNLDFTCETILAYALSKTQLMLTWLIRGYRYSRSVVDSRALSWHRSRLPSHNTSVLHKGALATCDFPKWTELLLEYEESHPQQIYKGLRIDG